MPLVGHDLNQSLFILQSIEEVKRELEKLLNHEPEKKSSAGPSSSTVSSVPSEKSKATDISHLIKRKKPEAANDNEALQSPAKKQSLGE